MISSKILAQNTERLNCDTKLSYHGWMKHSTCMATNKQAQTDSRTFIFREYIPMPSHCLRGDGMYSTLYTQILYFV